MMRAPGDTAAPPLGVRRTWLSLDSWPVLALIGLIALSPLLLVWLPPLVDLFGHVGRYAVQTELVQRPALQPYFSYQWKLIGNLGGDILVQLLHPFFGLEGSVRAVVMIAQGLGAAGLLLVAREVHGRITPFAVAAIPFLYGYPFNYGFINYALSMALALLAFVVWLRLHRSEGAAWRAQVWLAVAGAAIWVCHTYGWAFLGLLTGSAVLAEVIANRTHPVKAIGRILAACWPLLLPIAPMVLWRAGSTGVDLDGWSLPYKLNWLMSPLRTQWRDFDIASTAAAALLLVWALFSRTVRYDRGLGITALLCLAFFWILPTKVFGSAFADMRLLPYGFAVALVAIGPVRTGTLMLRLAGAAALAFFVVRMASTGAAYVEQDGVIQRALPALDKIPVGSRVAFFSVKRCRTIWAMPVLDHVAGLAMARRSAFVNDQWQQPGVNPLKVHYPAAEPFTSDPSHLVRQDTCIDPWRRRLSQALRVLPRRAFTHVWIVGPVPAGYRPPPGYEPIAVKGTSLLYRVTPAN
jgi:hypothetical protein